MWPMLKFIHARAPYFVYFFILIAILFLSSKSSLMPLKGEEGYFAWILSNQVKDNSFLLVGQIDNNNLFQYPEHPILMYKFIDNLDFFSDALLKFNVDPIQSLRLTNFLSLLPTLIIITFLIRNSRFLILKSCVVLTLFVTPFFLISFFGLQTDTLFGSMVFSFFGLLIFLSTRSKMVVAKNFLFLLAGIAISTGKQEWTFFLFFALILFFLTSYVLSKFQSNDFNSSIRGVTYLALGSLIGNVFSYLVDPYNYLAGLEVFKRIIISKQIHEPVEISVYIDSFMQRFPFVALVFFLISFFFVSTVFTQSVIKSVFINEKILLLLLSGVSIMLPFASLWNMELRYFAPGFSLSVLTLSWLIFETKSRQFLLLLLTLLIPIISIISFNKLLDFDSQIFSNTYPKNEGNYQVNCVNFSSAGIAFNYPGGVNWISQDLGIAGARKYIQNIYGDKYKLC